MSEIINPKDRAGSAKAPTNFFPVTVLYEASLGIFEGALKYGGHNWRKMRIRASVYFNAAKRHLDDWHEGEDIDPDSGLHHVTKAISCLAVLRDAMIREMVVDDRPPKSPKGWMLEMHKKAQEIQRKYPDPKKAFTEIPLD